MYRIFFIALLIGASFLVQAKDVTRTYNNKDFTEVNICCGMKLRLNQADQFSVRITADQKDFDVINVDQRGGTLRIYISKVNYRFKNDVRIEISMPDIRLLDLSGGSLANIKMETTSNFAAKVSGGGFLKGNLDCRDIKLDMSGGSKAELSGKGRNLDLSGSGGSIFQLKDLYVQDVDAQLSGGSNVKINMDGTLNTSQSGGSQIIFFGTAKIGRTSFSGGSGVSKGD
jgi:hypothetical protein